MSKPSHLFSVPLSVSRLIWGLPFGPVRIVILTDDIGTTAVAKSLCLHGNSVGVSRFSTWHRRSLLRRRFCDRLVFIMALSPEIESVLAGMFVWVRSGVVG